MKILIIILLILTQSAFSRSYYSYDNLEFDEIISELVQSKSEVDQQIIAVNQVLLDKGRLSGKILDDINVLADKRMGLRTKAYEYFSKYNYLVTKRSKKVKTLKVHEIKGLMNALAVAVTLFDVTNYTYINFLGHRKLRILLNEADSSYKRAANTFKRSIKGVYSLKTRKYLRRAISIYKKFYLKNTEIFGDEDALVADRIIQSSFVYSKYKNGTNISEFFKVTGARLKISVKNKLDFFSFIGNSVIYYGSKLFGNVMGSFQKRRGKLYQDSKFLVKVKRRLEPLDILLEKTPFRLTDKFIPGYWGHAAIYIGNQRDLKKLGIWDHDLVQKYKEEILSGRSIVEALRSNVQINSLDHFTDIDDFAIIRLKKDLTDEEKREHILRALSHVGKLYDFSFDVETAETIVCSELHYRTFINVDFNTSTILGRPTISVDQVAEQAYTDMPFETKLLYIDGEKIKDRNMQAVYDQKLSEPIVKPAFKSKQLFFLPNQADDLRRIELKEEDEFIDLGSVDDLA
jgi:hypothetical protein